MTEPSDEDLYGPLITERLPFKQVSMRGRLVWMTLVDWACLEILLQKEFPEARYFKRTDKKLGPPLIRFQPSLMDGLKRPWPEDVLMTLDTDWQPKYARYARYGDPSEWEWVTLNKPQPSVLLRFTYARPESELRTAEKMGGGDITFYCRPGHAGDAALCRRFYRVVGKVVTNRDQAWFRMPGRTFSHLEKKGSLHWLGRDAIRWAREDPARHFVSGSSGWVFRPADPE